MLSDNQSNHESATIAVVSQVILTAKLILVDSAEFVMAHIHVTLSGEVFPVGYCDVLWREECVELHTFLYLY